MRADKMTSRFQQALADAQSRALGLDNQFIEPLHLMVALLEQDGGSTVQLLRNCGVDAQSLRVQFKQALDRVQKYLGRYTTM